jgi:hypothetical protein
VTRQVVFWHYTATLEVGQRENGEADERAIRTGRHPAVLKRASGVVIRKSGKEDYTKLKAYRSISLFSCMGKVVEKVATNMRTEEIERRGLPSDGQFGTRKGR